MSKPFAEWARDKEKISMSEQIGKFEEFKDLRDNALVHVDEREMIACCKAYTMINPEDKGFNEFLETLAIPVLRVIGRARWFRSELSELGFAMSHRERASKTEDAGKLLEE